MENISVSAEKYDSFHIHVHVLRNYLHKDISKCNKYVLVLETLLRGSTVVRRHSLHKSIWCTDSRDKCYLTIHTVLQLE